MKGGSRTGLSFKDALIPLVLLALCSVSITGFHYPLGSHALDEIWDLLALGVALIGLSIRFTVAGNGINSVDNEALLTAGPYSVIRHPRFLGTTLVYLGATFFEHEPVLAALSIAILGVHYRRRIRLEEAELHERFGAVFEQWASRIPPMFPALTRWTPSASRFDWRAALLQEHATLLAIGVAFAVLELAGHYRIDRHIEVEGWWVMLLGAGITLSATVLVLKRFSTILNDDYRRAGEASVS